MQRKHHLVGILCALAAVTVLNACGGGGGSKGPNARELLVIDTVPIDGGQLPDTNPPNPPPTRSQEVKILFSANPDPATVLDGAEFNGLHTNVRILNLSLDRVPGIAFLGGLDAEGRRPEEIFPGIDPAFAEDIAGDGEDVLRFIYDTDGDIATPEGFPTDQFTVIVSDQVTNVAGDPILEPFCGSFTTGPDMFAPVVRNTVPANGDADVDLNQPFLVEFNERVVPSTVIGSPPAAPGAITLTAVAQGAGGGPALPIMGTITGDVSNRCRYRFTPSAPMPGSSPGARVQITATVSVQVSDFAGNALLAPSTTMFTTRNGPTISNNPIPPNALWFGSSSPNAVGVVGVNAAGTSPTAPNLWVDTNGDGMATAADDNTLIPTSINREVGTPTDMVLGAPVTAGNIIDWIPLDPTTGVVSNPPLPLPLGCSNAAAFGSVCALTNLITPNCSNSDIGTFLYVCDTDNDQLRVLNSNTSLQVDAIPLPDPTGVAISADLTRVFVSNFGTNSVSVLSVTGGQNQLLKTVTVNPTDPALGIGQGPRAIVSQPDMEDVLVLCERDESLCLMSFQQGFEVRKVISSNIGPDPVDIAATWRGTTWFGYISNRGGNTISVFESGPNFPTQVGPDDIKAVLQDGQDFKIRRPTRMQTDLTTGIQGSGVWYVNGDDGSVGQIVLTFLGPPPNPYFPNPAPSRVWGQTALTDPFGRVVDIALGDNLMSCASLTIPLFTVSNWKNNFGQLSPPIKGYLATGNSIRVFNAANALDMGIEIPVPGVTQLLTHWKQ